MTVRISGLHFNWFKNQNPTMRFFSFIICLFFMHAAHSLCSALELDDGCIMLVTKKTGKENKTTGLSENNYVIHGNDSAVNKTSKMIGDPEVLFKVYRCEKLIVVYNGSKIKKTYKHPLLEIVSSSNTEFNVYFVYKNKIMLDEHSIDVSGLPWK